MWEWESVMYSFRVQILVVKTHPNLAILLVSDHNGACVRAVALLNDAFPEQVVYVAVYLMEL